MRRNKRKIVKVLKEKFQTAMINYDYGSLHFQQDLYTI